MSRYPVNEIVNLPDPLEFSDHTRVRTAEEWHDRRRPEILRLFREHVYGFPPEIDLNGVEARHVFTQKDMLCGRADRKVIEISVKGNGREHCYNVNLFVPKDGKGPYPVFLLFNIDGIWDALPTREKATPVWPVEQIIGRGYATAVVNSYDIAPDYDDGYTTGLYRVIDNSGHCGSSYGTISAWAWGVSRIMDYFEKDPDIDASRVALTGFSRGGKTALWTAAQDERFAMCVSMSSGCTGAAIIRGKTGEQIDQINARFPYWFCDNYQKYNHNEDALPVDQHMLLSLIAPRLLYVISKTFDDWADPDREFDGALEASKVYEFLGAEGLPRDRRPLPDTPMQEGSVGYHIQTGTHGETMYDWMMMMDFADRHMKGDR